MDGVATTKHTRAVGAGMILAAFATVLLMSHHPTGAHAMGALGTIVHGGMILALGTLFVGYAHYSMLRGLDDGFVLAALVAYGISTAVHIGAAIINGFVVPALAAREGISHDVFLFAWEANQALADVGVYATGIAYLGWSLGLLPCPGMGGRLLGALGLATGFLPAAALASGRYGMNVEVAFAIYTAHALFSAAVGGWLWWRTRAR